MHRPAEGEFYRDIKGRIYQVRMLAKETGSGRELVVFQAMYAPFLNLACSLSEFMNPVDTKKYPDTQQQYYFEQVLVQGSGTNAQRTTLGNIDAPQSVDVVDTQTISGFDKKAGGTVQIQEPLTDEELEHILCFGNIEKYVGVRITEDAVRDRGFMMFLDADNFRKKRQIFISLKPYLTGMLLNNIAVTLDLILEEKEEDAQFDAILKCLGAREHYEGGRLR